MWFNSPINVTNPSNVGYRILVFHPPHWHGQSALNLYQRGKMTQAQNNLLDFFFYNQSILFSTLNRKALYCSWDILRYFSRVRGLMITFSIGNSSENFPPCLDNFQSCIVSFCSYISLRTEVPFLDYTLQRFYSISSSPDLCPGEIHLTVAVVHYNKKGEIFSIWSVYAMLLDKLQLLYVWSLLK